MPSPDHEPQRQMAKANPPEVLSIIPPHRIAMLVEEVGVTKANLALWPMLTLAVLAGAFIAFGAMFYSVVVTGSELGYGPTRLLGGVAFSLGLVLVIVGGAELFTGNSLIVMAWASRRISALRLLRNWAIVYAGNFVGAVATATLVDLAGILTLNGGEIGDTAVAIATAKIALGPVEALTRGVLCNVLVCLAVWMCFAASSVSGRVLAILLPISGFVAMGLEHSIANMYFLPVAMLHRDGSIDVLTLLGNLAPVTVGNVLGGGGLVALVYWLIYRLPARSV